MNAIASTITIVARSKRRGAAIGLSAGSRFMTIWRSFPIQV
jgi:hypothetical protein